MKRSAITSYEGTEPYIFISYAHKDSAEVFPVLEELSRRGYRVWYDDGIAPGSEWPENIACHLSGCALTIAFISPNSIDSANCRREVTFALAKQKPFLAILLTPTEMSLGMEMQLSAQQCVMKYSYTSDADFYAKVCSCPDIAPCLKIPESPVTEEVPAAPMPEVRPEPEKNPMPAPKAAKSFPKWIPIAAVAVLVIALILVIVLGGNAGTGAPQGSDPQQTETDGPQWNASLTYEAQVINADVLESICSEDGLQALSFRGCSFEPGILGQLVLPELISFTAADCTGVDDLSAFSNMSALEELILEGCDLDDNTLKTLSAPNLKTLSVSGCSAVTDITPLASMEKLESLSASGCGIASIDTVFQCLRLKKLDLSHNALTDVSAFANCTVLTHVDLSWNAIEDVEFLGKSAATLQVVDLAMNTELYSFDLECLSQCTAVTELYLDGISLYDLDWLSDLSGLQVLSANHCSISDIGALINLPNLTYIGLSFNFIEDLSPLLGLTGTDVILDLGLNNNLADASALPDVRYACLNLLSAELSLTTMPQLEGDVLILGYSEGLLENADRIRNFDAYVLVACPADRRVAAEDLLGIDAVTFVDTEEEYVACMMELGLGYAFALEE